jgi:hypothetical protein
MKRFYPLALLLWLAYPSFAQSSWRSVDFSQLKVRPTLDTMVAISKENKKSQDLYLPIPYPEYIEFSQWVLKNIPTYGLGTPILEAIAKAEMGDLAYFSWIAFSGMIEYPEAMVLGMYLLTVKLYLHDDELRKSIYLKLASDDEVKGNTLFELEDEFFTRWVAMMSAIQDRS